MNFDSNTGIKETQAVFTEQFFETLNATCLSENRNLTFVESPVMDELYQRSSDGTLRSIELSEIEPGMTIVIPCEDCLPMGDTWSYKNMGQMEAIEITVEDIVRDGEDFLIMTEHGALSSIDCSEVVHSDQSCEEIFVPNLVECGDIRLIEALDRGEIEWER